MTPLGQIVALWVVVDAIRHPEKTWPGMIRKFKRLSQKHREGNTWVWDVER